VGNRKKNLHRRHGELRVRREEYVEDARIDLARLEFGAGEWRTGFDDTDH
jgi:hypothetical protein